MSCFTDTLVSKDICIWSDITRTNRHTDQQDGDGLNMLLAK